MSVRRQAAHLVTAGTLLGGLPVVGAAPAYADEDRVTVRAPGGFTAGGSPGGVSMEVRKRTDGCVLLRAALGLSLTGLDPAHVQVQVNVDGRWFPVPVSDGGGGVVTARTSPADPTLCKGKTIKVRYRVAFGAGAPAGRMEVLGEATTAAGGFIGRGVDTSRVGGRAAASPSPSREPTPTAAPSVTGTPVAETDEPTRAVLAAPSTGQATAAAVESAGGSMIMWFGVALVAVGVGLIALLVRNNRKDRKRVGEASGYPAVPLPRNPGPTTYRSGGGLPGSSHAPTATVYGQQPAPAPTAPVYGQQATPATRAGGLYGSAGAFPTVTPGARPTGGVYGSPATPDRSRPAASGSAASGSAGLPQPSGSDSPAPSATPAVSPASSGSALPSASSKSAVPSAQVAPGDPSSAPQDGPPAVADSDSTSVMPGLPG
ncbi:hypothetical protein E1193_12030 [Micromonospora sp. KC606]|uniref:hypothetical protein n=1 Tax=Micromonospora sp. KC606 TaxID=2530379 RepID=UPI001049BFE7|nr:hypothetical protein [Micromonospora sp. KC606]TDC82382.1 hypothetical protein E1193_12030 [Micromonospora sp. KC606]